MSEEDRRDSSQPPVIDYQRPGLPQMQWRTVWTARNSAEANLAVGRLQELGLTARVDMELASDMGPWAGTAMGTKVQVLEADAEAARAFLLVIDQRRERRQQAAIPQCPSCAARHSKRVMSKIRYVALGCIIAAFVVGWFAPELSVLFIVIGPIMLIWPLTPRWRCDACGHRWIAPEPEVDDEDEENERDDEED